MNNRMLVALLLCTAMALPVFAQQGSSGSSTQAGTNANQAAPPAPGATSTDRAPLQQTQGDFWDGEEPSASALILHPFASKGYVRRQTAPIRDRLNELEQITADDSQRIKEIDTHSQHGIQLASDKTKEADQHATEAMNKAQTAQDSTNALNTRISKVETGVGSTRQYKPTGSETVIRFRSGQTVLSKDAKQALDQMASDLKGQRGYVIEVRGFSPASGQAGISASRQMADAVQRYLVLNHEIPTFRIYVVGLGNAVIAGGGSADKRASSRVEVSVLKNSADQVASTSGSPK